MDWFLLPPKFEFGKSTLPSIVPRRLKHSLKVTLFTDEHGEASRNMGAGIGANVSPEGARFRVWAPRVSSVSLRVEGGSGEILMHTGEKGYLTTLANGLGPSTRYFYLLDGNQRRPDPVSRFQPAGVHGPSEVIDPRVFPWEDHFRKGIPPEEMILYEIHAADSKRSRLISKKRGENSIPAIEISLLQTASEKPENRLMACGEILVKRNNYKFCLAHNNRP